MESMGRLMANAWNFRSPFQLVAMDCINGHLGQGSPIDETRTAGFDFLSRMDERQGGVAGLCGVGSAGGTRKIAGPGCRRQRHSSGACECARAERLGQRPERHRQCGQSAGVTAADHHSGYAAQRILCWWLPAFADAAGGQVPSDAICGIQIAWLGGPGGR
jgi:hypothetical protein